MAVSANLPKNIVLLSDGTGNSAAQPFKTNVWRLYQALDIDAPNVPLGQDCPQISYYDEGVGTGPLRPFALLGQAFGIGLAKNVKDLYAFLCRTYRPDDAIFLFGFSRGAFTVRILADLIIKCGLVTAPSELELKERVELAYTEYKRDAARRATATRTLLAAGQLLGGWRKGFATDHIEFRTFDQHFPRIKFIGVWDTVDAYGMPIDELKTAIDRHVWPMTLADRRLSDYIDRACHALSLDDERLSFRPVLWTDPKSDPRLRQVWFAGVHADVGGGYADDGLAFVTLKWMMDEAGQAGLRFYPQHLSECASRANVHGEHHDSRAGVAGYYRYGPRDVQRLCADRDHEVSVASPYIHEAALYRIWQRQVAYAPISIPATYREYAPPGRSQFGGYWVVIKTAIRLPFEHDRMRRDRANDMETARDAVWLRAAAYFVTVALTGVLVALPLLDAVAGSALARMQQSAASLFRYVPGWSGLAVLTGKALTGVGGLHVLPDWSAVWRDSFARHPAVFLFCGAIIGWLFARGSDRLQQRIFARAEYAWRRIWK